MSQNFIIRPKVYPFDLMVSIGETAEQLERSLKRIGVVYDPIDHCPPGAGRYVMEEDGTSIIILHKLETPEDYGTLHHEIFHYVFAVVKRIGAKFSDSSEEMIAYFLGYITEEIMKSIIKHKPKTIKFKTD